MCAWEESCNELLYPALTARSLNAYGERWFSKLINSGDVVESVEI